MKLVYEIQVNEVIYSEFSKIIFKKKSSPQPKHSHSFHYLC